MSSHACFFPEERFLSSQTVGGLSSGYPLFLIVIIVMIVIIVAIVIIVINNNNSNNSNKGAPVRYSGEAPVGFW